MSAENNTKKQLEQAIAEQQNRKYILRLYVSGSTVKSKRAIENLRKLSEKYLKDRYKLEIIDIRKYPDKAKSDQVITTPFLVKELPEPIRMFVGDLTDTEKLLVSLDVKDKELSLKS